jgi:hypothetical protein
MTAADTPAPTAAQIEEMEGLIAKATPGPWFAGEGINGVPTDTMTIWPDAKGVGALIARTGYHPVWDGWFQQAHDDAALIVAAVNALPALLAAAKRATAMEKALRPFAEYARDTERRSAPDDQLMPTTKFKRGDFRAALAAMVAP